MNDTSFLKQVEKESGERISACYQCYKCTNGCPVLSDMDVLPHRVIRYVMLGEREKVLRSNTIWKCLGCYTCSVRCPNDIHIGHVFDTLRKIAVRDHEAQDPAEWKFDNFFLDTVRKYGRIYELEAVMRFKMGKIDIKASLEDAKMGFNMVRKGRINIIPHNVKDRKGIKEIFGRVEETGRKEP